MEYVTPVHQRKVKGACIRPPLIYIIRLTAAADSRIGLKLFGRISYDWTGAYVFFMVFFGYGQRTDRERVGPKHPGRAGDYR